MGMFSTIDAMVKAPLEEVISEIPISEEVKDAILEQKGKAGLLFQLMISYEKADWKNIKKYADDLNVPTDIIAQIYFNCLEQVNTIWESFVRYESEDLQDQIKASLENEDRQ